MELVPYGAVSFIIDPPLVTKGEIVKNILNPLSPWGRGGGQRYRIQLHRVLTPFSVKKWGVPLPPKLVPDTSGYLC